MGGRQMFGLDRWLLAKTSCTCLQKYCTKQNISTAICKTSFIMRRGFDICNTFANLCPLCSCKDRLERGTGVDSVRAP